MCDEDVGYDLNFVIKKKILLSWGKLWGIWYLMHVVIFCVILCHTDGIMIISLIVPMLTNYLGMPLIYLMTARFFSDSEGVNISANLRILWFGSLFYHQRANHGASSRPSRLTHISILSDYETKKSFIKLVNYLKKWSGWIHIWRD